MKNLLSLLLLISINGFGQGHLGWYQPDSIPKKPCNKCLPKIVPQEIVLRDTVKLSPDLERLDGTGCFPIEKIHIKGTQYYLMISGKGDSMWIYNEPHFWSNASGGEPAVIHIDSLNPIFTTTVKNPTTTPDVIILNDSDIKSDTWYVYKNGKWVPDKDTAKLPTIKQKKSTSKKHKAATKKKKVVYSGDSGNNLPPLFTTSISDGVNPPAETFTLTNPNAVTIFDGTDTTKPEKHQIIGDSHLDMPSWSTVTLSTDITGERPDKIDSVKGWMHYWVSKIEHGEIVAAIEVMKPAIAIYTETFEQVPEVICTGCLSDLMVHMGYVKHLQKILVNGKEFDLSKKHEFIRDDEIVR